MRKTLALVIGSLLAAGGPAMATSPKAEADLAKALEGRVAGEPVRCLYQRDIRSSRIFNDTAILYETRDGTYYVNRPENGASSLSSWDVLVTDTHSPQLCNIDVVHLWDNNLRMQTGVVFLGDFVPYEKTRD